MRVLVRADASHLIGSGHLVRTLTLATALRAQGADVTFACRNHPGNMIDVVGRQGFRILTLPVGPTVPETTHIYSRWLGTSQEEDVQQVREVMGPETWDWIVVDHYGLDANWEQAGRPIARRIMVIDDLANRHHACDLLLDQNFTSQQPASRYAGLVPDDCRLLLGPNFALLKPVYAETRKELKSRLSSVRHVMVYFGGAPNQELISTTMRALALQPLEHLEVDLVLGNGAGKDLERFARNRAGRVTVHRGLPDLAGLMANADLAIGAGGSTTWERMCMGLPSVVISVADNQVPACKALATEGAICYLGPHQQVTSEIMESAVRALLDDAEGRTGMVEKGMALVDGRGVSRVAEALRS